MALTLDSTLAADTSNSYVNVAYCDEYWQQHYLTSKASQWAALSAGVKSAALIQACRVIEGLSFIRRRTRFTEPSYRKNTKTGRIVEYRDFDYEDPIAYSPTQSLQFPRSIDVDTETGDPLIPEGVKMAQCEQALYLLNFDESTLASRLQGVEGEEFSAGPVTVSQKTTGMGTALAPMALEFLRPFMKRGSRRIVRA